jgi:hypothetical protein
MTLQELALQGIGDKKPARLQSLESFGEIAHQPHHIGSFQDTQRSRKRETPAQSNGASDLFID